MAQYKTEDVEVIGPAYGEKLRSAKDDCPRRCVHRKRRILWTILFMVLAALTSLCAQEDVRITADVVYGHKDGMALTMDVYQPKQDNGVGVLFMVSGGWFSIWAPPQQTIGLFKPLLDKGFTVFAVRHGSSPKYVIPEIVQDVRRSVRFVRLHAKDFHIDPERLGVFGFSAGGHLSLVLGTTSDDGNPGSKDEVLRVSDRVATVAAYFPPTDLRPYVKPENPYIKNFPALGFDPNDANDVSPLLNVTGDDPPALMIHGDKDFLVPLWHSEKMCEALKAKGVESELLVIEGAGHGFAGKDAERANKALVEWFEKYLLSIKQQDPLEKKDVFPKPQAARSVHLWYPAEQGVVYYNEVTVEKSYPGSYFCVCGFNHGYFGIQELSQGKKVVLFSVWDPGKQNDPDTVPQDRQVKVLYEGKDVRVSRFGNEGTGGKSMFDYQWKAGETYKCMVKASVEGDQTSYAAYFYINEEKKWKHLATFQTITGGDYLSGYYSFVEDFLRNGESSRNVRRALYGNGWVKTKDGNWLPLTQATFTADGSSAMNIDAGIKGGRFFLQNGGDTENHTPLKSGINCPVELLSRPQESFDGRWELVWADEFNYEGLPDESKWAYETGFIRNREKQYYTKARSENARVENGTLVIESRKETYEKGEYTSASLNTWHKADWLYGRIEVRAKLPTGNGMWPAIWMLGTNRDKVGWPACGEIDIMENVGFEPNTIHANIHTRAYNHVKGTNKGSKIEAQRPYEQFNIYAIEWFEDRIDFFLNDKKYFTFKNEGTGNDVWPYDKPHYLLINAAIGGTWGGQKGIDDSIFPQKYYIDYVRVFKIKSD